MTLQELIDSFRTDADDTEAPYLWPDVELVRWFNEAEEEAAIRGRLLFDDTLTVSVAKDMSAYPFTALFEITRATLFRVLDPVGPVYARCGERLWPTDRVEMDRIDPDWRTDKRDPTRFIQEDTRIFLPCIVDRDYQMRLEGYRLPKVPFTPDDLDASPEIGPAHHRFLVHWVLHRAYQKPDTETLNPQKSAIALAAFEQYFGLRPDSDLRKDQQANRPHRNQAIW